MAGQHECPDLILNDFFIKQGAIVAFGEYSTEQIRAVLAALAPFINDSLNGLIHYLMRSLKSLIARGRDPKGELKKELA